MNEKASVFPSHLTTAIDYPPQGFVVTSPCVHLGAVPCARMGLLMWSVGGAALALVGVITLMAGIYHDVDLHDSADGPSDFLSEHPQFSDLADDCRFPLPWD